MKKRQRQSLVLNVMLIFVAALLGTTENFAANQPDSLLSQTLQRGALPVLAALIAIMVVGQLIIFRLDSPEKPHQQWDPARTPYPGLEPFAEKDAAVFFGRDGSIRELIDRLHSEQGEDWGRFVVVAGASGSGKSSLVQAGLIPRLKARRWIVLPVMTPGSDPIGGLAKALGEMEGGHDLRLGPGALTTAVSSLRRREAGRFSRIVLIVDQLEELFTLSGRREREFFLSLLKQAVEADNRFWVIAPMRVEYLREFLDGLHASIFGRPMALGAIARADLATVIQEPAALAGMRFEPGLVGRIVADTETSEALPLLAYLLQELYFISGRGKIATFEDYEGIGGVTGALARQADEVVARNSEISVQSLLAILLQFVTIDSNHATRRRVRLDSFTDNERLVVDAFVDARLLVVDGTSSSAVVQVAHEALFRYWAPLRQEVQNRAEFLHQRAELERWAADWQNSNRKSDYLLTGERLQLAVLWSENLGDKVPAAVKDFIEYSRNHDLATLKKVAESISEYVLANVDKLPDTALMLALAALAECPPTPAVRRALLAALAFNHLANVLMGHTDDVWRLRWSPDGRHIATASLDGTSRVWDAGTGQCTAILAGHTGTVEAVAWSPDSRILATTSRDQHIRLWAADGEAAGKLSQHADVIRAIAWSPDGTLVASGADDIVRIWDVRSRTCSREFRGHTDNVFALAFSPDGRKIASGSHDRTLRVWDIGSGDSLVIEGHTEVIEGIAWSPDGARIASSSSDLSVRVWNPSTGDQQLSILGHTDSIWNVSWSPDGRYIATCGADRTARIWDSVSAAETVTMRGHTGQVFDAVWSPDGRKLATGSADQSVRIWNVDARGGEVESLVGHDGPVRSVVSIPSSPAHGRDLVASCGDDRTIRIWDVSGAPINVLRGHTDSVLSLASSNELLSCSSDRTIRCWRDVVHGGTNKFVVVSEGGIPDVVAMSRDAVFATGSRDKLIRIWNSSDGSPIAAMAGHQEQIAGLAWSPSGRYLASASDDRTVRIWDMTSFREIGVMYGHASWVDSVSWSPDERFIVTGSEDQQARIWSVDRGEQVAVLSGHQGRVHSVAWSPDGSRIATGSYDTTVRTWDPLTGAELGVIGVHRDKVTSIAWTAECKYVISGSFDGSVRIWRPDVDLGDLTERARARVFGSLSDDERRAHLLPVADP